jgi:Rieske Fe-S protein
MDEPHIALPTLWPLGFAVGIAVALVGLIVDPVVVSSIGGGIAIVFGILWARDASAAMRGHVVAVEPETRALQAPEPVAAETETPDEPKKFARSRFLEASTLGLGGVIGGVLTVPVAGFALLPGFLGQKRHEVDLGPITDFPEGKWFITTFVVDPKVGDVSRRTAFVRNNGLLGNVPSFTIISNRCAHLGCPVQANGPTGAILGEKNVVEHTQNGPVLMQPVVPAGFGCPCHGGQYDTEGNRTAGPPVRGLDRYAFDIKDGRLILLSTYSVTHVDGTGAQAKIHKYKLAGPGEHINGWEQILYPLQPPHH